MDDIMKHVRAHAVLVSLIACLLVSACAMPPKRAVATQDPGTLYGRAVEREKAGDAREAYQSYLSVYKL